MNSRYLVSPFILYTLISAQHVDFVNLGGGGMNIGILVHPSVPSLVYSRQDVSGLYRWNFQGGEWEQLLNQFSWNYKYSKGCDGVAVIPNPGKDIQKQNTVFAAIGVTSNGWLAKAEENGLFRSYNRGENWEKIWEGVLTTSTTTKQPTYSFSSNGNDRWVGECIGVDPFNPEMVYVGTRNDGLYLSENALSTKPVFTKHRNVPVGFIDDAYSPIGIRIVLFDPRKGSVNVGTKPRTKIIYLGIAAKSPVGRIPFALGGVYRSTDGGNTFVYMNQGEFPTAVCRMELANEEGIWATQQGDQESEGGIFRLVGDTWKKIPLTSKQGFKAVATDPADPKKILVSNNHRSIYRSIDDGSNWSEHSFKNNSMLYHSESWIQSHPDWGNIYPALAANFAFDPHHPGQFWFGDPYGVYIVNNAWSDTLHIFPRLKKLETTVVHDVCVPFSPSKIPLYSLGADIGGFRFRSITDVPQKSDAIHMLLDPSSSAASELTDIESYRPNGKILALIRSSNAGYSDAYPRIYLSTDDGIHWRNRKVPPPTFSKRPEWAGNHPGPAKVAFSVSDSNHLVFAQMYSKPHYTKNAFVGDSIIWEESTGITDWPNSLNPWDSWQSILKADAKNGNRFYFYAPTYQSPDFARIWISDDGGATWGLKDSTSIVGIGKHVSMDVFVNDKNEGEMWISQQDNGLWRTKNGGISFQKVNENVIKKVKGFAFGKGKGDSHPSLGLVGTVVINNKEQDGIFISDDLGQSFRAFTEIEKPWGGVELSSMTGDMQVYGRFFIGTSGTGVVYTSVENSPQNIHSNKALLSNNKPNTVVRYKNRMLIKQPNLGNETLKIFTVKGNQVDIK